MIASRFNIIVEDYPAKGQNVLYNARTQALVKIDHAFRDALRKLPGSLEGKNADPRLKAAEQALIDNGIVVRDAKEDQAKIDDFFRQLKHGSEKLAFEVTILTTYACNFRCVYCFEESVRDSSRMSPQVAARTSEWLARWVMAKGIKDVFVVFYGGEPLMNTAPIRSIGARFGHWARANGIGFGFGIISNGSLLTRELVDELLPLGLKELRITVDGERECHNAKRPAIDGGPTFDLIIENIKRVADVVPVAVVGNFDRANYDSIPRFLDFLDNEGLLRKLKYLNFLPISPRLGPKSNPAAIELGECVSFFGKESMFMQILEIKRELLSRGLDTPSGLAVNGCSLVIRNAGIAVDPHGDLFKCNALLGYPEFSVGTVFEEQLNARDAEFAGIDAWQHCEKDCPHVPLCQGGCRFFSFIEHGNLSSKVCKREYFDRIVPELIKLEYSRTGTGPP
jgi:uncharacterized protein